MPADAKDRGVDRERYAKERRERELARRRGDDRKTDDHGGGLHEPRRPIGAADRRPNEDDERRAEKAAPKPGRRHERVPHRSPRRRIASDF